MEKIKQIEHQGFVKEINGNDIKVSIIAKSACLSCQLNTSCSVSDVEEKIIDLTVNNPEVYQVGESIDIFFKQTLGYRALFLGYLLPFIIVFFVLTVIMFLTKDEGVAGLTALGALFPYYFILYLKKDKIRKTFSFSIKKSNISPLFSRTNV